jgi:hypothetical protein
MDIEKRRKLQAESQKRLRAARRPILPPATCPTCGAVFQPLTISRRFCGDLCRKKAFRIKKASEKNG